VTTAVADPTTAHTCLSCTGEDDHPKIHILAGRSIFSPKDDPKWVSLHHDCFGDAAGISPQVDRWREELLGDPTGEGEKLRAIVAKNSELKGHELRGWINEFVPIIGNGPTMASGMAVAQAEAIVAAFHINSSTATVGTITITGPINVRAMATAPTSDNNAGTEITTGGSYTSGGTGLGALSFGSVAVVSNIASITTNSALNKTGMPVCTIVALAEYDSSATKLATWWGSVTSLTTNSGDTVSIGSGGLVDTLG
jgi:hypothetical protein